MSGWRRSIRADSVEPLLTSMCPSANRFDRLTHDVEGIIGRPATSARAFVARHAKSFAP
jgi:hypothetical protein